MFSIPNSEESMDGHDAHKANPSLTQHKPRCSRGQVANPTTFESRGKICLSKGSLSTACPACCTSGVRHRLRSPDSGAGNPDSPTAAWALEKQAIGCAVPRTSVVAPVGPGNCLFCIWMYRDWGELSDNTSLRPGMSPAFSLRNSQTGMQSRNDRGQLKSRPARSGPWTDSQHGYHRLQSRRLGAISSHQSGLLGH
ncbi:hypothetical protein PTTG_28841 [Puccinia triticina 1-1 BBBD Race 1]|uniref:Uncharacterized protein n=1 Tax=Puccinia triticina (isolate 1-1 / race 1 (BBBD)) TaxID=630390 RepID=A0A180G8N5_PUCT1|nr:hypothetical protein PTTG_28841 [Puccinia triticina 1-1 BBBD Race 1]